MAEGILVDAIRPVLNRLVFTGIEACRDLFGAADWRIRGATLPAHTVRTLATVSLDRIASELGAAGLERKLRTAQEETWNLTNGRGVTVQASAAEASDPDAAMAREYATLLTRTVAVSATLSVHVGAPAPLLALWLQNHKSHRIPATDSPVLEDVVELVACLGSIVRDVQELPEELRTVVAQGAGELVRSDSFHWIVSRALADAREAPSLSTQVLAKFREIADLRAA